jgi:hypothetical protein
MTAQGTRLIPVSMRRRDGDIAAATTPPTAVMAGHSRLTDGVATLAYDPAIHDDVQHAQQ